MVIGPWADQSFLEFFKSHIFSLFYRSALFFGILRQSEISHNISIHSKTGILRGMDNLLTRTQILGIKLQQLIDFFTFIPVGIASVFFMRFIRKNTFINIESMRERYRDITKDKKPTLICSNHLTMFDSIYIHFALNNVIGYIKHFRLFSWNVPAVESFKNSFFISLLTFLGKCIPIDRTGSSEHHKLILNKLKYLLLNGETVTMFPEGGRSRTGKLDVENVRYGAGNILQELDSYQVACIYMRGLTQKTYTTLPEKGDQIYFSIETIEPRTEQKGIRGSRDISLQIINKLKEMEDEFFRKYPESQL